MELKDYQISVLDALDKYLAILKETYQDKRDFYQFQTEKGSPNATPPDYSDYPNSAWTSAKTQIALSPNYQTRLDGLDRHIPNICFKIPTGGGKTLLATRALQRIQNDYFKENNGFVLWIVPSETIYQQTSKQLRDRQHPYRQMLDRISGGTTKILEKNDKFQKYDVDNHMCVMLLMLQSGNRQNKETLRIFRDSGKFTSFFPEADDHIANDTLLKQVTNLDIGDLLDNTNGLAIKHSLGNVMKLIRPIIIIDEGHKATSKKALETINGFHPRFILELSATPKPTSNILVDIKGNALKCEEMIKLPIHVSSHTEEDWKQTLNYAHKKLGELHENASDLQHQWGRYIRPIMLIKAEPKKKNDSYDHVEEIKKYLINHLDVPDAYIRIKLSEKNEIKNEDLLDSLCPVRYIITKEALKEGWDCPFAYILAILTNAKSETALTQFIGRVLRQPDAVATPVGALNESYVFCMGANVDNAVQAIKKGLESEGMGDVTDDIVANGGGAGDGGNGGNKQRRTLRRHRDFKDAIFLPTLNVKKKGGLRAFDYYRDILADIKWQDYNFDGTINLQNSVSFYQKAEVDVKAGDQLSLNIMERKTEYTETPRQFDKNLMVRQLMEKIPNPFQAARIIDQALRDINISDEEIANHSVFIVEEIKRHCLQWVLKKSEFIFKEKIKEGKLFLKLIASPQGFNWHMPDKIDVFAEANEATITLDKSIFQPQYKSAFNDFEYNVASYINKSRAVKWWHRLGVKGTEYHVQGWKYEKIYPDFLIRMHDEGGAIKFQFIETKGNHLEGNTDSEYKQNVFDCLNQFAKNDFAVVGDFTLRDKQSKLDFKMVFQDGWESALNGIFNTA